jgi:hypothetical protein
LLQQAVNSAYEEAGVYDGTVEKWPTFKDVLNKARNMDTRGRESGWLSSTLRALSSLCFADMDRLLNYQNNTNIEHILDRNVILELDALTQSGKTFFVQSVLLYIHHKRMAEKKRETFRHCIVLEEAHQVLTAQRTSLFGGESVMDTMYREIREFGESLVLLDQMPSRLSTASLANTYTTICLNLKHKSDINAMSQCMLLDKEKDILGSLEVGEAVVKLQGRIARPFQLTIPEFKIDKGKITDNYIKQHMHDIAPAFEEEDFRLPTGNNSHKTKQTVEVYAKPVEVAETAFLRDVLENPESGIAARYKRLDLSVRQGQKLKIKLLEKELINEYQKTTKTGRLRVIHLTEKGNALLSKVE